MNPRKVKLLYGAIITLIVLNVSLMAFLFFNRPERHSEFQHDRKQKNIMREMAKRLGLSDEQREIFEPEMRAHMAQMRAFSNEMQATKARLGDLLDKPEQPEVTFLLDSLATLHWSQEEEIFRHTAELYEICEPHQQKKIKELFKQSYKPRKPRPE